MGILSSFSHEERSLSLGLSMEKTYKAGLGEPAGAAGKGSHNQKKPSLL